MAERVAGVRARMESACRRVGRDPASVELVAVAKTFGPDVVREAAEAGVLVVGENRVQEAVEKIPLCPSGLRWHFVGHLQTNKAGPAVAIFDMLHAVDSAKLLERLEGEAEEAGKRLPVCLEINVSGERSKFGMAPEAVPEVLARAGSLRRVEVVGLMTIPPFAPDPETARPFFRRLRELRDRWRGETGLALDGLSMGMSGDFEVAIEEGATWVRLGSLIFGQRQGKEWRRHGQA